MDTSKQAIAAATGKPVTEVHMLEVREAIDGGAAQATRATPSPTLCPDYA